eukprot:UN31266
MYTSQEESKTETYEDETSIAIFQPYDHPSWVDNQMKQKGKFFWKTLSLMNGIQKCLVY